MLLSAPDTILPAILLPRHRFLHDIIRHELREKGLWAGLGDSEVEWKVVRNHHRRCISLRDPIIHHSS